MCVIKLYILEPGIKDEKYIIERVKYVCGISMESLYTHKIRLSAVEGMLPQRSKNNARSARELIGLSRNKVASSVQAFPNSGSSSIDIDVTGVGCGMDLE